MASQLGLATILVQDMALNKAFYIDLLGFEIVPEFSSPAGDFVILHSQSGGTDIALQDANVGTHGVPLDRGGVILGFMVADADVVYREWQSKSVEIMGEVIDMGAGRLFNAKDPAGNYLQIYHLHPQIQETQKQREQM